MNVKCGICRAQYKKEWWEGGALDVCPSCIARNEQEYFESIVPASCVKCRKESDEGREHHWWCDYAPVLVTTY